MQKCEIYIYRQFPWENILQQITLQSYRIDYTTNNIYNNTIQFYCPQMSNHTVPPTSMSSYSTAPLSQESMLTIRPTFKLSPTMDAC